MVKLGNTTVLCGIKAVGTFNYLHMLICVSMYAFCGSFCMFSTFLS